MGGGSGADAMIENITEWTREFAAWAWIKAVAAGCFTFALDVVGYPESAFLWLVYLMLADFALGFSRAWKSDSISSRKLRKGAYKFLFVWVSVALLVFVDRAIGVAFKTDYMPYELQDFYIAYLCIGEFFSCAGHLAFFGVRFPASFLARLEQYRMRIEGGAAKNEHREDAGGSGP
jgi:toxin secretion/phage lysis holin